MTKRGERRPGDRRAQGKSVAELVPEVGRKAFRRFGFVEGAMVARWAEIVGPAYAQQSTPESLRFPHGKRSGGTLTLAVTGSHALLIQHVGPQIIERVNRFFGYDAVARIAIQQGRAAPKPSPVAANEVAEIPEDMVGSLKAITDDRLRASLEDLARQIAITKGPPLIG